MTPVVLAACVLALSSCGGDDDDQAANTAESAPATTEQQTTTEDGFELTDKTETEPPPPATETESEPPATSPEDQPGGAGDEEAAHVLARFTGQNGAIVPRVVRVPAFIAIRVEIRSADRQTYGLKCGDESIEAGGQLGSVSTTIDGLRPDAAITCTPTGPGNPVRISATAQPGP